MKITKDNLQEAKSIIDKLIFNCHGACLFFPLDLTIHHTDEYGIESAQYKGETRYGATFIPGLVNKNNVCYIEDENTEPLATYCNNDELSKYIYKKDTRLGYASTTELISFNLAEYFSVIDQKKLTEEEKDFICGFECCLCRTSDNLFISRIPF